MSDLVLVVGGQTEWQRKSTGSASKRWVELGAGLTQSFCLAVLAVGKTSAIGRQTAGPSARLTPSSEVGFNLIGLAASDDHGR